MQPDILEAIRALRRDHAYLYLLPTSQMRIDVVDVVEPYGPIIVNLYDPTKGQGPSTSRTVSISAGMIRRYANAFREGVPVNIDRVLGGSYNTRSALESLLAHTPEFYYCYPGRIDSAESSTKIEEGHKHLLWLPNEPHWDGVPRERRVENMTISEISSLEAIYDAVVLPEEPQSCVPQCIARRHAQIQIALAEIGIALGFRIWIAQNDKAILYKGKRLGELDGVIKSLEDERLLAANHEGIHAALLIDVIWFRNARFMPAVIEVEHTTGVTSGLTRMKNLQDILPPIPRRWVVAAADEDCERVMRETNKEQFHSLNTWFLPYSSVDELYSLCQRRNLRGTNDEFLDSFMVPCLSGQLANA